MYVEAVSTPAQKTITIKDSNEPAHHHTILQNKREHNIV